MEEYQEITISDSAKELVGATFNPSDRNSVYRLKRIAAEFITECEKIQKIMPTNIQAMYASSRAIDSTVEAQRWAVKAVTADLK